MKRQIPTPETTGIMGADTGCGTTHLALTLANVAASRLHKKTALIGIRSEALTQLLGEDFDYREGMYHFSCMGFEVFAPAEPRDISYIAAQNYDEIVIDFGHSENVSHEFALCKRKYVTGSLAPFRWRNLDMFFNANYNKLAGMRAVAICLGTDKNLSRFKKAWKLRCMALPYIPDPLCLTLRDTKALLPLLSDKI